MEGVLELLTKNEIFHACKEEYGFLKNGYGSDYFRLGHSGHLYDFWTKGSHLGKVVVADSASLNHYAYEDRYFFTMDPTQETGVIPAIKGKNYDKLAFDKEKDIIELYEYPSSLEDSEISEKLDALLFSGDLEKTGRSFEGYTEYYYNNTKYIKVDSKYDRTYNDRKIRVGEHVWFKVEPIKWINLKKYRILVCSQIISSAVFDQKSYLGKFKNTQMYQTLNQMYQEMSTKLEDEELSLSDNDLNNPLKFEILDGPSGRGYKFSQVFGNLSPRYSDFSRDLGAQTFFYKGMVSELESKNMGYLPIIDYSLIKDKCEIEEETNYCKFVRFGEYPDYRLSIVDKPDLKIYETGKTYSVPSGFATNKIEQLKEYEIDGRKCVRLGNGQWYKVNTLTWYVDLEHNKAICYTIPFAGIDFTCEDNMENSALYKYLVKHFSKDIIPSKSRNISKINEMVSSDIAIQMLMKKQNITINDLEIEGESNLVLRR